MVQGMRGYRFALPWLFWYAVGIHLSWGLILLGSDAAASATPVYTLVSHAERLQLPLPWLLFVASALAICGLTYAKSPYATVLCLLPQQGAIVVTAGGALTAALSGHYPDGVARPWAFILADQIPSILIAIFHTLAMLDLAGVIRWPQK